MRPHLRSPARRAPLSVTAGTPLPASSPLPFPSIGSPAWGRHALIGLSEHRSEACSTQCRGSLGRRYQAGRGARGTGAFVTLIAELRSVRLVCEQVVCGEHLICSDRTVRSDHIVCDASTHEKHEHYPGHEIKALLGKRVHRSFS